MSVQTILIVEDQFDNRAIYSEILRHGGFNVVEAVNGAEGYDAAREHRPDLILMDLSMPVLDGWQAMERLMADPATRAIPVLAVSAHVLLKGAYERVRSAGFVAYLTKPVEPKQVLEAVRATLAGEDPRAATGELAGDAAGEEP